MNRLDIKIDSKIDFTRVKLSKMNEKNSLHEKNQLAYQVSTYLLALSVYDPWFDISVSFDFNH